MHAWTPSVFALAAAAALAPHALAADPQFMFKFNFGSAPAPAGFTAVTPSDLYAKASAKPYGFEDLPETKGNLKQTPTGITSDNKPFYFSAAVPEGNYRVTLTAGSPAEPTDLTVKAELRRLMIEHAHIDAGKSQTLTFIVNIRTPAYPGGRVSLKAPRETTDEFWAWDEKLTLEFNNAHPNIQTLTLEKVDVPVIYLVGDSTMCDQSKEPWSSWGQSFTRFWKDDIAIANHAESGETVAASLAAHRFDKVWSLMHKGDYLFFAFGHNDMKTGAVPLNTYIADYHRVIAETRAKGGIPVVVSSMERMNGVTTSTLAGYPDAARQVAAEDKALFIDLHTMSQHLYQGIGPKDLHLAFSYANGKQDATHNNDYGSYEISSLMLQGIRDAKIDDLLAHLKPDLPTFDPAHPLRPADFKLPLSAFYDGTRPAGD